LHTVPIAVSPERSEKPIWPRVRIALRDASAETEFAAIAAPSRDQLARFFAHRHCHLDRALRWVGARHRIVKRTP